MKCNSQMCVTTGVEYSEAGQLGHVEIAGHPGELRVVIGVARHKVQKWFLPVAGAEAVSRVFANFRKYLCKRREDPHTQVELMSQYQYE
jgi:hypothetical protein